jgi:hypothetical protein
MKIVYPTSTSTVVSCTSVSYGALALRRPDMAGGDVDHGRL